MATAAEVQAQFEAFKVKIVKEALKASKDNGWCSVVEDTLRKCDLGEYLPATYVIEQMFTEDSKWELYTDEDELETPTVKKHALEIAKEYRQDDIDAAKHKHTRDSKPSGSVYLGHAYVYPHSVDNVIAQLTSAKTEWEKTVKTVEPFVTPAYPQYRVVKRDGNRKNVEVVYTTK